MWRAARRSPGGLVLAVTLMALQFSTVTANTTSCSSGPGASTASSARVTCAAAAPDPTQTLYDKLRARLGGDLANALTSEERLTAALNHTSAAVQILTDQIT